MPHQQGKSRQQLYNYLVRRDGEKCFVGGEEGTHFTLVIDHLNNDKKDDSPGNLHLCCRSVNHIKNPSHKKREPNSLLYASECASASVRANEDQKLQNPQFWRSEERMSRFRHWLFYNIVKLRTLKWDDMIESGAAVSGLNITTLERNIRSLLSNMAGWDGLPAGMYERSVGEDGQKIIRLKPQWDVFRGEKKKSQPRKKPTNGQVSHEDLSKTIPSQGVKP